MLSNWKKGLRWRVREGRERRVVRRWKEGLDFWQRTEWTFKSQYLLLNLIGKRTFCFYCFFFLKISLIFSLPLFFPHVNPFTSLFTLSIPHHTSFVLELFFCKNCLIFLCVALKYILEGKLSIFFFFHKKDIFQIDKWEFLWLGYNFFYECFIFLKVECLDVLVLVRRQLRGILLL